MQKRKVTILLLSPFFYPEAISTGKYNTHLVKALVHQGFSVDVISSHPIYPDWKPKRTNVSLPGVKIYRGGGFFPYPKSMVIRRVQLELWFMFHTVRHILLRRKFDIVIPVFPPMLFFIFVKLLLPQTTKKIGIVHDIQGIMAVLTESLPRRILVKFIRLFEKRVFNSCDKLIFLSNTMAYRAINDYGLEQKKVSVCYPFVTLENRNSTNALRHLFPSGYKHIVYSGAIGEKQAPHSLLKLFQAIVKKRTDIYCHIFSRGPLFEELREANYRAFDRILFHDLVPEQHLLELYLRSDIQIIPQKEGASEGSIPSKLPNVISAGVPVFAISDPGSELSQILRESGIGYCADSWDIDNLVVELNNFLEISSLQSHNERQWVVNDFVMEKFNIDRLVQAILE